MNSFRIFKEDAGIISEKGCWVCIAEGYLYTAPTLAKLIRVLNTEWKQNRHLVGMLELELPQLEAKHDET